MVPPVSLRCVSPVFEGVRRRSIPRFLSQRHHEANARGCLFSPCPPRADPGGDFDPGTDAGADPGKNLDAGNRIDAVTTSDPGSDVGANVDNDDEPETTGAIGCGCTTARPLDVAGAGRFALTLLLPPCHRRV